MVVNVRIPQPLHKLTQGRSEVEALGKTVRELLDDLENKFPGMGERLYDQYGNVRRFINIYVNDEDIRLLNGDKTELKDGDEVSIIPSIAGGEGQWD
ncbi:MAG: MoaD/ThiS family protein [Actinobacteria bacterium]|nr:MoaD/ThiS family protein [Actinomycetota bacterium]